MDGNLNLPNFNFEDAGDIAERVLKYHSDRKGKDRERIIETRKRIADFCASYLSRIEDDLIESKRDSVKRAIESLRNSDPDETIILMTAHQPNLFAYSGVFRKIALLKAVEEQLVKKGVSPDKIICLYCFADHDFVHNKWVRSAEMPAPLKREGLLRFSIGVSNKDVYLPSNKISKPSSEKLQSWRSQINGWVSENCALASKHGSGYDKLSESAMRNLNNFWTFVEDAQSKSTSLAEFSSFILATTSINSIEGPIIFANFSDCFKIFGKEYEWLLSNTTTYGQTIKETEPMLKAMKVESDLAPDISEMLPVWLKCECGSKYKLLHTQQGAFSGKCMRCDNNAAYTIDELIKIARSNPELLEPRSMAMVIVFSRALDMSCYVSGVGGVDYLMHSMAISEKLNSPMPPTPYWNVRDMYCGIDTVAAASECKRISGSYSLAAPPDAYSRIGDWASSAAAEMDAKLKEGSMKMSAAVGRDRKLLDTITISTRVPSCSISYAINIGLGSTYKQWLDFLSKGRLDEPVAMDSIVSAH